MAPTMTPEDVMAELADYHGITGSHRQAAQVLIENLEQRFLSVCESEAEAQQMVTDHLISVANDIAAHVKTGAVTPSQNRSRACKILQYALNDVGTMSATEAAVTKMGRIASAMQDWCLALEAL